MILTQSLTIQPFYCRVAFNVKENFNGGGGGGEVGGVSTEKVRTSRRDRWGRTLESVFHDAVSMDVAREMKVRGEERRWKRDVQVNQRWLWHRQMFQCP